MKKVLSFVMIMISLLGFDTGRAQASGILTYAGGQFIVGKGIAFVFQGSGFKNRDLKNANIFVGSDYYKLSCNVNKDDQKIVCVAGGGLSDEFAGESGIIYLAKQVFYVVIPGRDPLRCGGLDALGADVEFKDMDGLLYTEFLTGTTLEAVENSAVANVAANELLGYKVLGTLYCEEVIEEVEEEVPEEEVPGEEIVGEESPDEGGPDEPLILIAQPL